MTLILASQTAFWKFSVLFLSITTAVPRILMSQAGSPPSLGKPVGLLVRVLLSSFCHLQSVIRPLQPQPMSLLSRAINPWDSALNGEIADNGRPMAYNSTNHNHTSQMCSSTFSYQAFFSQNPVVATAHTNPSAWV